MLKDELIDSNDPGLRGRLDTCSSGSSSEFSTTPYWSQSMLEAGSLIPDFPSFDMEDVLDDGVRFWRLDWRDLLRCDTGVDDPRGCWESVDDDDAFEGTRKRKDGRVSRLRGSRPARIIESALAMSKEVVTRVM